MTAEKIAVLSNEGLLNELSAAFATGPEPPGKSQAAARLTSQEQRAHAAKARPVKLPSIALFLMLTAGTIAAGAAPAPAPRPKPKLSKWQLHERELFRNSAPADEYFGRMKMSYLGMNNTFRDSAISSGEHTTDARIAAKVALAEDALEDWGRKYPRDPELARTYFLALQVERKLWMKPDQDRAWVVLNRLAHDFPATYFGKLARHDLAIGFTEHYYAPAVPCPTPAPTATPAASPSPDAGTVSGYPAVTPSPSPTPSPAVTPSPGPVETTLSRGLHAEVLPQPCVQPPTPSPSPAPSPSPSPSPTATPTNAPAPTAT